MSTAGMGWATLWSVYVSQGDSMSQLDIKGDIDGVVVELGALAHLRAP